MSPDKVIIGKMLIEYIRKAGVVSFGSTLRYAVSCNLGLDSGVSFARSPNQSRIFLTQLETYSKILAQPETRYFGA
jgi:hypothetical protein